MNGRDIERDLSDFFRDTPAPRPSDQLRESVAAARGEPVESGLGRHTIGAHRPAQLLLSLVGLAASIVLTGGWDGSQKNDVWRSTDKGATWTMVNASAGWTPRSGHSMVVIPDGSIILTGSGAWRCTLSTSDRPCSGMKQPRPSMTTFP